ncbi:unnamed protein product, partial [Allacma fusca]
MAATPTTLPAYVQRWITPSPKQLERVLTYRNQQRAENAAGTPTSNTAPVYAGNFIGIIRKECVLENEKLLIGKEVHYVSRTIKPQNRIQGLIIPESIFKSDKVQICVYLLSEQLAVELNIRRRMRCSKKPDPAVNDEHE